MCLVAANLPLFLVSSYDGCIMKTAAGKSNTELYRFTPVSRYDGEVCGRHSMCVVCFSRCITTNNATGTVFVVFASLLRVV